MLKISGALCLTFLLGVPLLVQAGSVFKWVDEHGVVHYTDQRPNDRSAEQMGVNTNSGSPSTSSDNPEAAVDQMNRQQEIDDLGKRQQAETDAEKEHRKEICEQAKKNLDIIQNNARIKIEENGNQRFLTPEEIISKREQYQKSINESCQ